MIRTLENGRFEILGPKGPYPRTFGRREDAEKIHRRLWRNPHAVALGARGGRKGGFKRWWGSLTPAQKQNRADALKAARREHAATRKSQRAADTKEGGKENGTA